MWPAITASGPGPGTFPVHPPPTLHPTPRFLGTDEVTSASPCHLAPSGGTPSASTAAEPAAAALSADVGPHPPRLAAVLLPASRERGAGGAVVLQARDKDIRETRKALVMCQEQS